LKNALLQDIKHMDVQIPDDFGLRYQVNVRLFETQLLLFIPVL